MYHQLRIAFCLGAICYVLTQASPAGSSIGTHTITSTVIIHRTKTMHLYTLEHHALPKHKGISKHHGTSKHNSKTNHHGSLKHHSLTKSHSHKPHETHHPGSKSLEPCKANPPTSCSAYNKAPKQTGSTKSYHCAAGRHGHLERPHVVHACHADVYTACLDEAVFGTVKWITFSYNYTSHACHLYGKDLPDQKFVKNLNKHTGTVFFNYHCVGDTFPENFTNGDAVDLAARHFHVDA